MIKNICSVLITVFIFYSLSLRAQVVGSGGGTGGGGILNREGGNKAKVRRELNSLKHLERKLLKHFNEFNQKTDLVSSDMLDLYLNLSVYKNLTKPQTKMIGTGNCQERVEINPLVNLIDEKSFQYLKEFFDNKYAATYLKKENNVSGELLENIMTFFHENIKSIEESREWLKLK